MRRQVGNSSPSSASPFRPTASHLGSRINMTTRYFLAMIALVSFISLVPGAYGRQEVQRVDNSFFESPRRPAAIFDHDDHNEKAGLEECSQCHHVFDETGHQSEFDSSEDQACGDCHGLTDDGVVPGLRKAYHLCCRECHLQMHKGPVVCAECHVKT
jgi:hypothetical protein